LESNPNKQSPLLVAYATSMVNELITGKKNQKIEPKIMNFIRYIDTISPKAAEIVSANLPGGPSKRWMQELNRRDRKSCLLSSSKNDKNVGCYKDAVHFRL
jgi:hypothetical protein